MIQKFGGVFQPAYQYIDVFEELPSKPLANIQPLAVDWKKRVFCCGVLDQ
jgi:hypothetical protein